MTEYVGQERSYEQKPTFPVGVAGLPMIIALVMFLEELVTGGWPDLRAWLIMLALTTFIFLVIAVAVLPQSMKRVRIDTDGMHVKGKLALPAHRIGQIKALSGGNAATQSWPLSRNRGLKMPSRQNLYGGLYGWGPAVGVEEIDRNGERVSSWLIPTRDPQGLAAALEHVRDHADTTTTGR